MRLNNKMISTICEKGKHLVTYGIFGVISTVVNIGLYIVFYQYVGMANVSSNIFAWILAVLFAFVTNKLWVFDSKDISLKVVWPEMVKFIGCRLATGLIDLTIMFVAVDLMKQNAVLYKVFANIIVIILNYAASKAFIFKQEKVNK